MPHPNAELIARFYGALARRDAEGMIACYHARSTFNDPVFGELDHDGAAAMWRMLCARGKDLTAVARDIQASDTEGRAHCEATYTYTASGRFVRNRIDASFTFQEGRIFRHVDRFDLYRWMRQALGVPGTLLGWIPMVQGALRARAARQLAAYRSRHPA
jgi:ketosteroid isomerase-like protein